MRAAFFFAASILCFAQTEDLGALSHHVKELMAQRRFEEAIPICEKLVKALPGNPGLLLNLGLALQMAGHPAKAIPQFEQVLKIESGNVPALTSLANSQLELNQPKAAIVPLKKLISLQPGNYEVRGILADAFMSTGQPEEAAAQYRKLTETTSDDAKSWYGLGKAYQASAERILNRMLKNSAQSGYVAALIASDRVQQRQYRSAFFFYKEAERRTPGLRGVHGGMAKVYRETGHADWATAEEKLEDGVPSPNCTANAAECYFVQNRYQDCVKTESATSTDASLYWVTKAYDQLALEAFARIRGLPESVESHAVQAEAAHGRNHELEAVKEWQAALKLSPGNPRLERELATSLFLARDFNAAMPMLEKQLHEDPNSPDLNFMLGESLLRTEEPDKATRYLEAALRVNSQMLPAHAALGLSFAKLGKGREAIPHLEKALELDDDGSLHYQLARAYQTEGNAKQAADMMAEYQKIQKQNEAAKEEVTKGVQITPPTEK